MQMPQLTEMRELDMSMISLWQSVAMNDDCVSHMSQKQTEYIFEVIHPYTILQHYEPAQQKIEN